MAAARRGTGGKEAAARAFKSYMPGVYYVFGSEKRVSGCFWVAFANCCLMRLKGRGYGLSGWFA